MTNTTKSNSPGDLRRKAEEVLKTKSTVMDAQISETEILRLFHELQVHQIELEMQNEELTLAQSVAQAASDQYAELYDFAPSGYFTLSRKGTILNANLTGAKMLGRERSSLIGGMFSFF